MLQLIVLHKYNPVYISHSTYFMFLVMTYLVVEDAKP